MKHQPRVEHRGGPTQTAQAGNENIGAGHTLAAVTAVKHHKILLKNVEICINYVMILRYTKIYSGST